ncbi:hypothetical protein K474DRAFT_1667561 [Panus rudis PR-1116 ss-1]|nr:hypothetical protein K474DRAFT_1667561 [Panus rudis PR-1116 ss-1]
MSTNPSHLLIARNSRGPNAGPSAALSSPTETHAAAAGIFRSSANSSGVAGSSPPYYFEEFETDEEDIESDMFSAEGDMDNQPIDVDITFTKNCKFPGTVKIVVESTTFWAHKEVLYFASPFFQAALSGNWAESSAAGASNRPQSVSSIVTISQSPQVVPGTAPRPQGPTEMTFASVDSNDEASASESEFSDVGGLPSAQKKEHARQKSLDILQRGSPPLTNHKATLSDTGINIGDLKPKERKAKAKVKRRPKTNGPDAVIVLKEEKAYAFHDFLKFVYPHLTCTITWNNVESLMNISHKLSVPALQEECRTFLLTHAAGRPIKAMRIAELFDDEELYREASRFVLDNPGGWSDEEMSTLSSDTLLKLEKRRTWFLERVLKLGLVQVAKEYQCCPTCPDPANCARLLDEKWRQSYHAMFRFGPCQPSMVFRYLRMLEGVSPPLQLTHLSCQATAKAFAATLFDRMFSLGMRGNPTDAPPIPVGSRLPASTVAGAPTGPRRHFLYCTLKGENTRTKRGNREQA